MRSFGPYVVARELGAGGMGVVYLARHASTGDAVALKTCQARPEALRAMDAEIRALRGLRHPGVVRVVDSGDEGGLPWMAMEYVEGQPLRSLFHAVSRGSTATLVLDDLDEGTEEGGVARSEGPATPVVEVASLFVRVCNILAWLHGEGVVHGDLKPENVLIRSGGQPVLVDFGLLATSAARAGEVLDGRSRTLGTIGYLPPEAGTEACDARSDLYAVGCMLYEALTGAPPFSGTRVEILRASRTRSAPRVSSRVSGVPPILDRLVAALLARDPRDRPAYATDVVAALVESGGRADPDPGPPPRPYLYRSRLVEREEERDLVRGSHPVVVVAGPPGSGRTRVLQEAERGASGPVLTSLQGRVSEGRECSRQLLRGLVNLCPHAEAAKAWFGRDADVLVALEPALGAHLGGGVTPRRFASRTVEQEQTALALTRAVSAAAPLRLVVDDLDRADPVAVATIVGLARRAREGGLEIRVSALAGDPVVEALAEAGARTASLRPLSAQGVHRLVADRLAVGEAPQDLRELIAERAGGFPYVAGELLHLLLDRALLVRRGDAWRLAGDTAAFVTGLADGDVIAARRLEALDAATVEALEWLAVAGDTPIEGDVDVEEARVRGIVRRSGPRWSFVHERFRARVLYAASPDRVAELHGRAADRLESAGEAPWYRARHLEAAGRTEEALDAWLTVARDRSTPPAVQEEAIEARLRLARGRPATAELRIERIRNLSSAFRHADALPHLPALEGELGGADPSLRFRARAVATNIREACGLVPLADLAALADEAQGANLPAEEALVRTMVGERRVPDAVPQLTRAVALLEQLDDRAGLARARWLLGSALHRRGRLQDAAEALRQAEPDLTDPAESNRLLGTRALVEINLGNGAAAESLAQRCVEAVRATGSPALLAQTLGLRAEVWRAGGRLPEALAGFDEADALADEIGDLDLRAKIAHSRVMAGLMAEEPADRTLARADQALDLAERVGNVRLRAGVLLFRATLQVKRGRHDDAERDVEQASSGYAEAGDAGGQIHALTAWGALLLERGRRGEAQEKLATAEGIALATGTVRGPFATAIEQLRVAIEQSPGHNGIG